MFPIFIYTIAYSQKIAEAIEPGYLLLDHTENERSDWREYWPIRNYLLQNRLDEDAYYGFFSPRFKEKTGLSYEHVTAFIRNSFEDTDAFIFSPQVDMGAFFQNMYYGGELMSPGFLDASQRLLDRNKVDVSLGSLFTDSRTTVFSNYVVARPTFWREWLTIGEMLFAAAETTDVHDELAIKLKSKTTYSGDVQRKVFVMESLATLVLNLCKNLRVHAYDPFLFAWSAQLGHFKQEAVVCDALKTAVIKQERGVYGDVFNQISSQVLQKGRLIQRDPYMIYNDGYDRINKTLLDSIPSGLSKVVEVGCMRGTLAKTYLDQNPGCKWIGIDRDVDHIEAARRICSQVICEDVESLSDEKLTDFSDADTWVLGDLLDRLYDPWKLLSRIRKVMRPGAFLIVSVSNAQHWSFQARLSVGQVQYEDNTVFDKTILRLFSRTTLIEMLNNAGFKVVQGLSQSRNHPDMDKFIPPLRAMAEVNGHDPDSAVTDAMAFKFMMVAISA